MFKIKFDFRAQELFYKEVKGIERDVKDAVNWYINQVYRDLSKQHGRRYTYVTPPGSNRTVLRKRSGRLLKDLREAKYVRKVGDNYEAGFNVRRGSYLAKFHVGERGESQTFTSLDVPANQRWNGRVMIPLKAALKADGTPNLIFPRQQLKVTLFHLMPSKAFMAEDKTKFHEHSIILYKQSGRNKIPMFVLAKRFTVPKRMLIREKMLDYYDDAYDRLDELVARRLNGRK